MANNQQNYEESKKHFEFKPESIAKVPPNSYDIPRKKKIAPTSQISFGQLMPG
jgi:hypothetical protein